jgi:hypothetical protein
VKAEITLQWAANAISGKSVSGKDLTDLTADLQERWELVLPERTLRYGLASLKLQGLASRLRDLIDAEKKLVAIIGALGLELGLANANLSAREEWRSAAFAHVYPRRCTGL